MDWSEQLLRRIYEATKPQYGVQQAVGGLWPYEGGLEAGVEQHLHELVADLEESTLVSITADFSSFGCGYASFVSVFCTKRDGSATK